MVDATFSHITVTPADDDEIIEAGAPSPDSKQSDTPATRDIAAQADEPHRPTPPMQTAQASPIQAAAAQSRPQSAGETGQTRRQASGKTERPASAGKARSGGYQEATLEDLQTPRMPLAQRIVIIAAVICIIGAIVYCVVAMG